MAYFDGFNKNIWNQLADAYSDFNPYPLREEEIQRSIIVANMIISNYQMRNLVPTKTLKFGEVLRSAATSYFNLGMHHVAQKAVSILDKVQFVDNQSYRFENLTVQSVAVNTGAMLCKEPYYIEVPRVFNSSSVHFMSHEIAHMLKESNPYECRGIYTDVEVIPILIELINAHRNGDNNVFIKREYLMYDIATVFIKLNEDRENGTIDKKDMKAFDACYRQNVLYLNSFYYSLILFNMYLKDCDFVLSLINDILTHRLTTTEVIDTYLTENNELNYTNGLNEFRSRLK